MNSDKKREFFNMYTGSQTRVKAKLAQIQVYLDAHYVTVSNDLWLTGRTNYGYIGDINQIFNILNDALVCLTGEGE